MPKYNIKDGTTTYNGISSNKPKYKIVKTIYLIDILFLYNLNTRYASTSAITIS